jgi:hypothetical protein
MGVKEGQETAGRPAPGASVVKDQAPPRGCSRSGMEASGVYGGAGESVGGRSQVGGAWRRSVGPDGGFQASGVFHPRRTPSLPPRGVRLSPRIWSTRLSVAEARLARRRSHPGLAASRDSAWPGRPEVVVPAFRRGRLASRGGPAAPELWPRKIRGKPSASRGGKATPDLARHTPDRRQPKGWQSVTARNSPQVVVVPSKVQLVWVLVCEQ